MNKKINEQFFIVYDKKRKGFVFDFAVFQKQRHGITKKFQNAKCFDSSDDAKQAIEIFLDKNNGYAQTQKHYVMQTYEHDDLQILTCEKTIEIKPHSLLSARPSWLKSNH